MSQSLAKIYVHLVFSTKERRNLIDGNHKEQLHAYIAKILANLDSHAVLINSMPDHIHILFNLSRTITLAKLIENIKSSSSKWLKTSTPEWDGWQAGYGAFSVSESQLGTVSNYIKKQEDHHKNLSFQDELRILLEKHHLKYDEKYLWG